MKRRITWVSLVLLLVTSLLLASCAGSTTTSTTSTTITTSTINTTSTTTSTAIVPSTTAASTVTATTTSTGNWWDSLGTPQYGGTMTLRLNRDVATFDPITSALGTELYSGWIEQLLTPNWLISPAIQPFQLSFFPNDDVSGNLVQTWEFTGPGTFVLNLRQNIYWQNIAPANGRQFVASDVVFHFDRLLGKGDGFTTPGPYASTVSYFSALTSITATDNFTVVLQFSNLNPEFVYETFEALDTSTAIECPDAVQAYGNLNDWHHAIGTGPFILTDFVDNSSAVMVKNPNYWAHDERFPQNQLPYVDKVNYLIIPDDNTALAAFRVGKIDVLDSMQFQQSQNMSKSNPDVLQVPYPLTSGLGINIRNDKAPYTDVRVREALQMAIDMPTVASTYYGGDADPSPLPLTSNYMIGWGLPYNQWPQSYKDQYTYNPTGAKQLLAAAGYPTGFNTDIVIDATVDANLVEIIQSYFSAIGVNMSIQVMQSTAFSSFVNSHSQDALAERVPGTSTLGLSSYPLRHFNRFLAGSSPNIEMVNDPVMNSLYAQSNAATTTDQIKALLIQANQEVITQHFDISLLAPEQFGFCQPWLKGYNGQAAAVSGTNGPLMLFFYGSRFWIDNSLE